MYSEWAIGRNLPKSLEARWQSQELLHHNSGGPRKSKSPVYRLQLQNLSPPSVLNHYALEACGAVVGEKGYHQVPSPV